MVITLEHNPNQEDISMIGSRLRVFNELRVRPENYERVFISVRLEDNTLIGGLIGAIFWDVIHIEVIWTDEPFRNRGIASNLLQKAEVYAITKKCYLTLLDTFDFQAPEFYKKRGYKQVGRIENYPKGHTKYYFEKELREYPTV